MFLVNSCLGLFSATLLGSKCLTLRLPRAILLPKLRMQFAEFLNEGFPAHLRILSPPTCVGFGTGCMSLPRSFSRQCRINYFAQKRARHHASAFRKPDLPSFQPTRLNMHVQSHASLPYCVTPLIKQFIQVQEYQPVVHRLRYSASA